MPRQCDTNNVTSTPSLAHLAPRWRESSYRVLYLSTVNTLQTCHSSIQTCHPALFSSHTQTTSLFLFVLPYLPAWRLVMLRKVMYYR